MFLRFSLVLLCFVLISYWNWQRQLVLFATLSDTFPSSLPSLFCLCCHVVPCTWRLPCLIHPTVKRGGVSWPSSCLKSLSCDLIGCCIVLQVSWTRGYDARPKGGWGLDVRGVLCCHGEHTEGPNLSWGFNLISCRSGCGFTDKYWNRVFIILQLHKEKFLFVY